ncbi:MAG: GAF domain-containing protein [Balneolales bacterium]|nr:GAF domain-containing protein [Balneolales bacterium]
MAIIQSKKEQFDTLTERCIQIIRAGGQRDDILHKICVLLEREIEVYDWVGFYIADPNAERELYLGPYVGEATDHTRIPFGKGICGQVAESHQTFIVDDVHQQDNYLSCNIHVKSEIVVPVMQGDAFVAQIDIDSHTVSAMDDTDQKMLETICRELAPLF